MKNRNEIINKTLDEIVHKIILSNGLEVYICLKKGYNKKIGMFGSKYGSIHNSFNDIINNEKISVPDGIAHFLEHKLFEQEDSNALDLFAKEGISANAYTTFDHTVYYFETIEKFTKGLEMLIKLVKTPYFTDENVENEKGIIAQEISMYEDNPNFMVYYNVLKAMYVNHPIKIDIAGTKESILEIDKEVLFKCYNTFYNPNNMFIVVVGDVNVDETIKLIESKFENDNSRSVEVVKYITEEPQEIAEKKIIKEMQLYMPQICIGYKMNVVKGNDLIKREVISSIISDMYFSRSSKFYEKEYNKGNISSDIDFGYEGTSEFSHVIVSTISIKTDEIEKNILEYIEKIKKEEIDEKTFETIKRKKIGENIIATENLNNSYRRIIDSILCESKLYYDIELLNDITTNDVQSFLNELDSTKAVISIVK